jgi:hypothetical protein
MQPHGLLKAEGGLQPSLLIDSSTILPTYTQKLAATIATYSLLAPGARKVPGSDSPVFVDAPVSGGVPGAVAASLTFMVGGWVGGWLGGWVDVCVQLLGAERWWALACGCCGVSSGLWQREK